MDCAADVKSVDDVPFMLKKEKLTVYIQWRKRKQVFTKEDMEIAGGLALLLPNAVCDICKRKISLLWTVCCAAAGLVWQIYMQVTPMAFFSSLLPGGILLCIGYMKVGSVGMGDALILIALGIWCGCGAALWMLVMGCILMSLICIPLLLAHRIQKDSTLPLVPFLLAGQILYWGFCMIHL